MDAPGVPTAGGEDVDLVIVCNDFCRFLRPVLYLCYMKGPYRP